MALPSGTITFLFTDIEGSTQLWQRHPHEMPAALSRHHAILNEAIGAHRGYVFQVVGDAFCAAFETPSDGLAAALAAQRALKDEPWGQVGAIRVRMALHTGTTPAQPGDYKSGEYRSGITLSRAARLLSAAHGGQILLSRAAAELLRDHLLEDVSLRDLGEHRLKDLIRPEQLYQAVAPDLPDTFPPPRTLDRHPHNLPVQLTRFIGREAEIAELGTILAAARLVTLMGPGGTGKTRLALQVAAEQLDASAFADGVFFIGLESINDPDLVLPTIADILGVRERPSYSLSETLSDQLRGRQMLLLIDNFEQVMPAAPVLGDLLAVAPRLKLLVTSRSVLQLYGEVSYAVSPLPVPDTEQQQALDKLARNESVALFVERGRAARASFELTLANAPAVVEICRQLDGLPLALELAAVRVRLLPPQKIVEQLQRRFQFLTGGSRDLPSRHQTLRSAIDWSYQLLAQAEQRLFGRLALFVGGCSLEAAQAVAGEDAPVLEGLAALVDQSLLYQQDGGDGEARFMMLSTLRDYGIEQLEASGSAQALHRQHAGYYHGFLQRWEQREDSGSRDWLRQLDGEYDNLRAALKWTIEAAQAQQAMEMCLSLYPYWQATGFLREGQGWLRAALATPGEVPLTTQLDALKCSASLSWAVGDFETAREQVDVALRLGRETGQEEPTVWLLTIRCRTYIEQGNYPKASAAISEALAISRKIGDRTMMIAALAHQGETALAAGDYPLARKAVEEAVELSRLGSPFLFSAVALRLMGEILHEEGDYAGAHVLLQESVEHGQHRQAFHGMRALSVSLATIAGFVVVEPGRGMKDWLRSVRIWSAVSVFQEATGLSYSKAKREQVERYLALARATLDPADWDAAWAEGQQLTLEGAVVEARQL